MASSVADRGTFLQALRDPGRAWTVELRPPPVAASSQGPAEVWIDMNQAVRSLLRSGRFILFTDDAVGAREEESIQHLTSNLGQDMDFSGVVPFLTCKHSLDYCLMFARRAASLQVGGITVTGGDRNVGPPRCLPRSRDLRQLIAEQLPELALGAWVNPERDAGEQVELLMDRDHYARYYLTQVVSHHELGPLDRFLEEASRQGLDVPGMVGVFYYRSPSRRTLDRLEAFIPVPRGLLEAEFASGASADDICTRTLSALEERGVKNVYISNLDPRWAGRRLEVMENTV